MFAWSLHDIVIVHAQALMEVNSVGSTNGQLYLQGAYPYLVGPKNHCVQDPLAFIEVYSNL